MQNFSSNNPPSPLAQLAASPRWYPHALDPITDRVLLIEKTQEDYAAASFLDDRSLGAKSVRHVASWQQLQATMPSTSPADAGYIFHIGHVGSTLISRLLGELPGIFALREPLLLRIFHDLAQKSGQSDSPWAPEWLDERIPTLRALLSRTFDSRQSAIVKATSFTSEIAPRLLTVSNRALFLYTSPQSYFENIFAGEASRQELVTLAGPRLKRLLARFDDGPWKLWHLSFAQKAALAWACEMTSLEAAAASLGGDRALWMDFDEFLKSAHAEFARAAHFFGQNVHESELKLILEGPLMRRYSKGLEYEYSPALRDQILAQSRQQNKEDIAEAMNWLIQAANLHPAIAACLQRTE